MERRLAGILAADAVGYCAVSPHHQAILDIAERQSAAPPPDLAYRRFT